MKYRKWQKSATIVKEPSRTFRPWEIFWPGIFRSEILRLEVIMYGLYAYIEVYKYAYNGVNIDIVNMIMINSLLSIIIIILHFSTLKFLFVN